jgi:rubrerythrin
MSTTTKISGASVWEQELYDHLVSHGAEEGATLDAYQQLVETTDSPAFAYLAGLILDDEHRHHQMLNDLAETIRASAELSSEPLPIPDLGMFRADRARILEQTEHFLQVEKQDQRELKRLEKELRDVRDTTAWQLVVRLMQHDNAKHQMILEFIRDRARKPL